MLCPGAVRLSCLLVESSPIKPLILSFSNPISTELPDVSGKGASVKSQVAHASLQFTVWPRVTFGF